MLTISFYIPKKEIIYVISFGRGSAYHGSVYFINVFREYMEHGEIVYADMLWHSRKMKGVSK